MLGNGEVAIQGRSIRVVNHNINWVWVSGAVRPSDRIAGVLNPALEDLSICRQNVRNCQRTNTG